MSNWQNDKRWKSKSRIEELNQVAVVAWARDPIIMRTYPGIELLHSTPNEGATSKQRGARMKRLGTLAGIPDLHLPVARRGFFGLWIEMKSPEGRVRESQSAIHKALTEQGHYVAVCRSADVAIDRLEWYLTNEKYESEFVEELT